ncbi:MAG TPA: SDR family NAD(P)-dependent oxidoreductase [Ramlibacter sp.]|uniref:SDR family NAD(P)-dependent oxidoreductase n=1 Tax=Ramlibacter sp. TaxID=1917967 RepID=UPI002CF6C1B9|nr:SDR family NAD(P)-dependent oxidoreductase [Ramlibacter sp.]HVZ46500.1 SDR family NAD(P)-dependent oxidoreductase [Ramlibacter sp.]
MDPTRNFRRDFEGKIALVTGAGAGIGRSIAIEFAERGGLPLVTDRDVSLAEEVVGSIKAQGGQASAMGLDVRDAQGLRGAVEACVALGGLDVVFNVAGTNIPKNVETMEEEEWEAVMETNLTSIFRSSKYAIPHMRRRGGGAIVNVASIAGVMAENRCGAYSASKGGVVLLTKNMAMDFARDNIRVNAVAPGSTRTPRTEQYWKRSPTGQSEAAQLCPMKRSAEPAEIARPALFLASDDASYITGAILVVDGGLTAGFRIPTFDRM